MRWIRVLERIGMHGLTYEAGDVTYVSQRLGEIMVKHEHAAWLYPDAAAASRVATTSFGWE